MHSTAKTIKLYTKGKGLRQKPFIYTDIGWYIVTLFPLKGTTWAS